MLVDYLILIDRTLDGHSAKPDTPRCRGLPGSFQRHGRQRRGPSPLAERLAYRRTDIRLSQLQGSTFWARIRELEEL